MILLTIFRRHSWHQGCDSQKKRLTGSTLRLETIKIMSIIYY